MIGAVPGRELTLTALALLAIAAGCGGEDDSGATTTDAPAANSTAESPTPEPPPSLNAPPCPPSTVSCKRASGQIAYVEKVDPDGDGDAHFVLISDEAITAPGVTVIDVRADLRPEPLPRPGDVLAASGPVYRGSYGQRQIQADAVVFERAADGGERLAP